MIIKCKHIIVTFILLIGISVFSSAKNNLNFISTDTPIIISMYPNPTSSVLNIDIKNSTNSDIEIIIFSYLGNIVYKKYIYSEEKIKKLTLNVEKYLTGIYIVQVISNTKTSTYQFKKL